MSNYLDSALDGMKSCNGARPPVFDEFLANTCPTVHALLTQTKVGEGGHRTTSTMTVFVDEQDGRLKACLTDRDHQMTLWHTISDMGHFWDEMEAAVTSPNPNWRKKKGTPQNYALRK